MLMSLIGGFLNADAENMKETRLYKQKQQEKKDLLQQELDKEDRAWLREIKKTNYNNYNTRYNNVQKEIMSGNISTVKGLGLLNQANQESILKTGKVLYPLNSLIKPMKKAEEGHQTIAGFKMYSLFGKGKNNTWADARGMVGDFDRLGNDPDFLKKFNAAPVEEREKLIQFFKGSHGAYTSQYDKNTKKTSADLGVAQSFPNLEVLEDGSNKGFNLVRNTILNYNPSDKSINNITFDNVVKAYSGEEELNVAFSITEGNEVTGHYISGLNEQGKVNLAKLSEKLKIKDSVKAGAAFQKFLGPIPNYGTKKLIPVFQASVAYAGIDGIEGLDPDANKLYNMTSETAVDLYKKIHLNKNLKNQREVVLALTPYMNVSGAATSGTVSTGAGDATTQYTAQTYAEKMNGKTPIKDILAQHNDSKTVVAGIDEIKKLTKGMDRTDAYNRLERLMIGTLSLKEGFLGDLLTVDSKILTQGFDATYEMEDGTKRAGVTSDFVKRYEKNILDTLTKDQMTARVESLKITLAFKMARAADPSGRLSNQDIELQLQKLGGGFTTVKQALSKLTVVRDEFQAQVDATEVYAQYGQGKSFLTPSQIQQFDAAIVAQHIRKTAFAYRGEGQLLSEQSTPEIDPANMIVSQGFKGVYHVKGKLGYFTKNNVGKFTPIAKDKLESYRE
tara:strand:- start:5298 stop:7319 length:2022 start_codon:yes stop_codon:yes gene_type:complete